MRSPNKTLLAVWWLLVSSALVALVAPAANSRSLAQATNNLSMERLRSLAMSAQDKREWPALRTFAAAAPNSDQSGQAYFVLGFREYQAIAYSNATDDLKRAADTHFLLADYAEYYAAVAANAAKQPQAALEILDGFAYRHPESVLRFDALALFVETLLRVGQPDRAIQALTAEPRIRQRPPLELLLAKAHQREQKLKEAAQAYQQIYYGFPTSHEASEAGEALSGLRVQLGARFPAVTGEFETRRAETLFNHSRIPEALKEYNRLLKNNPASPFVPRWKVGRARCLLRAKQTTGALDQLQFSFPANPGADAERLGILVEAYIQHDDKVAMDLILDQLRTLYPHSPSYASALDAAGNHLVRQGDWQSAARYYQPLAEMFPETQLGEEASWRLAWSYFLQKEYAGAQQAFMDHAIRYPSSTRVVADFYWLGRITEDSGAASEARAFYELVQQRWGLSYYAEAANHRMAGLQAATDNVTPGSSPGMSVAADLSQKVPPPSPPEDLCPPAQPPPALRPFTMLAALGLTDLAEQYLKGALQERPATPALYIALSRFEAEKGNYNPSVIEGGRAIPLFSDYKFSQLPQEIWNLLYPTVYWTLVEREAKASGIDPYLVMGLIRQESAFNPQALSKANARGLMQILPGTASAPKKGRAAMGRRLYDPAFNVRTGTAYLQRLLQLNQGVFEEAMAAYHAGEERVSTWRSQRTFNEPAEFMETIPIPATRTYVEKVVRDAAIYRKLMTAAPAYKACGR